jgi:hypothetical protein
MSENQFKEKNLVPDEQRIRVTLKSNYVHLEAIRSYIADSIGETKEEWKYYGAKYGWTLKNFYKKRNLYFIGMYDGFFKISFVFGERAFKAIMEADISAELKKELSEARKYAEGRGLSMDVHDERYLDDIKKLLLIKIKN